MAVDYKSIGERIQGLRKAKGVKQAALAERLGVSTGYVSQVETAKSKLNLELLINISKELGCEPGYLINGTCTADIEYKLHEIDNLMNDVSSENRQLIHEFIKLIKKHEKMNKSDNTIIY